jgi:hypothetical protein
VNVKIGKTLKKSKNIQDLIILNEDKRQVIFRVIEDNQIKIPRNL